MHRSLFKKVVFSFRMENEHQQMHHRIAELEGMMYVMHVDSDRDEKEGNSDCGEKAGVSPVLESVVTEVS